MNKRSLGNLLRVRRASSDEGRAILAEALSAEEAVAVDEATASSRIDAEVKAASDANADDATVEALAAWLPQARDRQVAVRDRCRQAEAATSRARAALAAARGAERLIENLIEIRDTEEIVSRERQAQAVLHEHVLIGPVISRD